MQFQNGGRVGHLGARRKMNDKGSNSGFWFMIGREILKNGVTGNLNGMNMLMDDVK